MSAMDAKMIYFPFLVIAILLYFVSWIGGQIKAKHLVLTNYVVMMGGLEWLCLVTQIVLSFLIGTITLAICSLVVLLTYYAVMVLFGVFWRRNVRDYKLKQFEKHSEN